ncbi:MULTISPECIES: hypothetical protein [Asticcacaulis]|uniref:hypothetical protein n=1 Tax=Asticcacaulis TaxID=76890 RepID=UPI001AE1539C|nr:MULTISPECIES: hypothetical protein [Asticcacaulis]MBP2160286.1 hypothetical protein [Asticcacaulis solisilvae]MDR6801411.1 hypothetical protein [Asticcacaulis sp. BE141]
MITLILDRLLVAAGIVGLMAAAVSGRLVDAFPQLGAVDIALYGYAACVACLGLSLVLNTLYPVIRRRLISGSAWAAIGLSIACTLVLYWYGDQGDALFGVDMIYVLVTCAILNSLALVLLVLEPVKLKPLRRQPRAWRMPPQV